MIIQKLNLEGAYVIEPELSKDNRGFFARIFCKKEFEKLGLCTEFPQWSISHNDKKNTLRGMHFQTKPYEEIKLVTCVKGAILDVLLDLRKDSKTYKKHVSLELNEKNKKSIYIPKGVAHGFKTLSDNSDVFYYISEFYHPECSSGVLYNDTAFNVDWGNIEKLIISNKDRLWDNYVS